jgi:hypothetical protein
LKTLKGRKYVRDLGTDDKILLKWTLKKQRVRMWVAYIWLRTGSIGKPFSTQQ